MKSKTRLDSAVFQLTPTRTRCDLYIIANDSKEKIASGLLNPFIAHLKAAQDQIAQGGYSVLLTPPPPATNATWFTKSTLQSFVRFVSTPEILERVYTIESEILQIQEAISIQGNNDILVIEEDQHVKPVASSEGDKTAYDDDQDKAIVLYKPGAQETTRCSAKEGNSKVQLLNVLETRKTVLKKEQGMAFARAVAAGFEIEHVANLLSFAECFGASRLMSGCLRFMDLWKQKHDSGQWVEVEAEAEAEDASGIVLSSMSNRDNETKETDPNPNPNAVAVGPHPGFPPSPSPWGMHSSPVPVPVPVYQAYPMPYYHQHYPGSAPFYPPPPYPSSSSSSMEMEVQKRRQSMDNNEEDSPQQHKNAGKKKSGRVVIRNINFINSKGQNSSQSDSDTDTENHTHKRSLKESESEALTLNGKETDSGHWDAFQNYLLKGNENMFAMEKDPKTKRRQKSMAEDPLANAERDRDRDGDGDGEGHRSYDYRNGRKIVRAQSGSGDDFMIGTREEANVRGDNGFDRNGLYAATATATDTNTDEAEAEAVMVSMLSTSGVNDENRSSMNLESYDLPPSTSHNQESKSNRQVVKYEPDALSLMPERDLEKRPVGYDPALDYEMQSAAASREKKSKTEVKKVSKSAEKHQQSKANQGVGRKGKPSSKVNNNTLEDARARAEKLRSYKADLQKMKKEQQDAEVKRLEGLKMERQKRIAARANSSRQQQQLASKLPLRGSKFTDSEPGSSSPLQRSKIRPAFIGSTNSKKPLTLTNSNSKLANGGNRLTRSLSDTKKEISSVTITPTPTPTPDSKTRIRRLSEPKKTNNNITSTSTSTKTRSAEPPISKSKKISCAIISLDQSKAASLPEIKIRTSKVSSNQSQRLKLKLKEDDKAVVAKMSLNDNPVIDKSVVMLEHKQTHGTGAKVPLSMEVVDKGTISIHPTCTCTSTCSEVKKTCVEEVVLGENPEYEAPYARVSSFEDPSTRNSEYAKAPQSQAQSNFVMSAAAGTEKAYVVSDFNKLEKIPQVLEKPRGFRRLLKLGKKNHTPSDTDTHTPQADTLKTLISSEDQTPTTHVHGQTCQKSSRHFSLLSSFRGKTTEKKPTA